MPDEFLYAELGRSLYEHGSLDVLGRSVPFYSLVHPALIGGPLSLGDVGAGYALAKGVQVVVMSLAAIPVYAWARRMVPPAWALGAAALTLALPGLSYSGLLMTETVFFPAVALTAWAMVRALTRPTIGAQAAAVGAVALASATRLQGLVLVPAFVTAIGLHALLERRLALVARFAPALGGLAVGLGAWIAWQLHDGGGLAGVLGGYAHAGETSYPLLGAARYVVYHLADVVLLTGVLPACAALLLAIQVFAGRERDAEVRAYAAVAVSVTAWFVLEVGVFASRHVHHLAERNLFHVAPMLFVGLAVWLHRGARRPAAATATIAAAALVLLVALPVHSFARIGAVHNELTLIPLYRLDVRVPHVDLDLLVPSVGLAILAVFALGSRRVLVALTAALVVAGIAASVSASNLVVDEATQLERYALGPQHRWIDDETRGSVTYLYAGPQWYPNVLQIAFWNRSVDRIDEFSWARVPALPRGITTRLEPLDQLGSVASPASSYVIAPIFVTIAGDEISRRLDVALTRVKGPLRVLRRLQGVNDDGAVVRVARLEVYGCTGGTLELDVHALVRPTRMTISRNWHRLERVRVTRVRRRLEIPVVRPRQPGRRICSVEFGPQGPILADRISFRPRAPGRRPRASARTHPT